MWCWWGQQRKVKCSKTALFLWGAVGVGCCLGAQPSLGWRPLFSATSGSSHGLFTRPLGFFTVWNLGAKVGVPRDRGRGCSPLQGQPWKLHDSFPPRSIGYKRSQAGGRWGNRGSVTGICKAGPSDLSLERGWALRSENLGGMTISGCSVCMCIYYY